MELYIRVDYVVCDCNLRGDTYVLNSTMYKLYQVTGSGRGSVCSSMHTYIDI